LRRSDPSFDLQIGSIFAPHPGEGSVPEKERGYVSSPRAPDTVKCCEVSLRQRMQPAPAAAEPLVDEADHVIDEWMTGAKALGDYFNEGRLRHATYLRCFAAARLQPVSPCVSCSALSRSEAHVTKCQFDTIPRGNPGEAEPNPKARSANLEPPAAEGRIPAFGASLAGSVDACGQSGLHL
jgi:hypothetical protein